MGYVAGFLFSNDTLSGWKKSILEREFVERREMAVDIVNPMFEIWNEEFDNLYPDKDGYSNEYSNFIREKQEYAINMANSKRLNCSNYVKLRLDEIGDIFGVCDKWDTTIKLVLVNK